MSFFGQPVRIMTPLQRATTLTELYRLRSDIGVMRQRAQEARSLCLAVPLEKMHEGCNEAIEEFQPDTPAPSDIQLPRRKF